MVLFVSQEVRYEDSHEDQCLDLHRETSPVIALLFPTVMNSLPISLYSHTPCTYIPIFPHPVQWHVIVSDCFSWLARAARQSTSLLLWCHNSVQLAPFPHRCVTTPSYFENKAALAACCTLTNISVAPTTAPP